MMKRKIKNKTIQKIIIIEIRVNCIVSLLSENKKKLYNIGKEYQKFDLGTKIS